MYITRATAAASALAALAAGAAAAPASAAPEMIGDYVLTETSPTGQTHVTHCNVNPCGDGCADIKAGVGTAPASPRRIESIRCRGTDGASFQALTLESFGDRR